MTEAAESVDINRLTRAWFKAKTAAEVAQQALDAIEADMKELKIAMKDWLLANGCKSTKTDFGTISLSKSTRYFTTDWPNYDAWIIENHLAPSAMFEHRIAQKNMAEFLEEHPGIVPPGLNSETDFSIRVTRPSSK